MFGDDKNLKDSERSRQGGTYGTGLQEVSVTTPYNKTNKLITALYMVTDTIDDEPIRNKLRTLGVEILSDTITMKRSNLFRNTQGILSFLDIAFTMNMISEMNKNILVSEFTQFKNSLIVPQDNPVWLEEFLSDPSSTLPKGEREKWSHEKNYPKGHYKHTSIGVQKGSTLLKALSDKTLVHSLGGFDVLKKQRRDNIINIIKNNGGSSTIKDIKIKTDVGPLTFSEKTLQRELMSMIKDDVLKKTGEKRWSRYFLK